MDKMMDALFVIFYIDNAYIAAMGPRLLAMGNIRSCQYF